MTADPSSRRSRLGRVLLDTAPLRLDRDFRWLWAGQAISGIGNQVTRLALPYQVYHQTGSTLAVAGVTLSQLIPILVFSLGAGTIADAVDRRRLLRITQLGLMASSATLAILAAQPSVPLPVLYLVAFVAAAFGSMDQPARSSSIPRLVARERLPAAIALNQLNFQIASVLGPTIAGLLIATIGLAGAYAVDVASFSASFVALFRIAPLPPLTAVARPGLGAIREGLRFARERRVILATYVIDLDAMIFGMPQSLFPAIALDVLHVGPAGFGILAAAPSVGALLGALLSGWVSRVRRVGLAVIVAVAIWGAAITLFGLSTFSFALAFVFLAIAGAADVISAVFRSTIVQLVVPDQLRGRISSINILVVTSGPRIGDIEAAAVASVVGPQLSVLSGGILCLLGLVGVVRLFPELARHVHERPGPPDGGGAPGSSGP
ncbi:MAG TPA: MFS transporter [Candidatus Limnocylindrales bacterium]|nr:MFS transporter [Candidatus Limnocylindrales bacterium]